MIDISSVLASIPSIKPRYIPEEITKAVNLYVPPNFFENVNSAELNSEFLKALEVLEAAATKIESSSELINTTHDILGMTSISVSDLEIDINKVESFVSETEDEFIFI